LGVVGQTSMVILNQSLVREDFKLLDDGREIPESQEKGWPFDSGL
jgi:hypothetical protein